MKKKPDNIKNNPVAKNAPEFCKPRTFRDRKKHPTIQDEKRQHDTAIPYKRVPVEDEIDYNSISNYGVMWFDDDADDFDFEETERGDR